jgi:SAM-dependent methyltransferase
MDDVVFRLHAALAHDHWWFDARRRIARDIVDALPPGTAGRRVVDIGCGVGANAPAFHSDYAYTGYDVSPLAIERARVAVPGARFIAGALDAAVRDLAEADVVLLMDVLEHVEDDHHLLADIVHATRPGAWLLVTVPAGPGMWGAHDRALGHYRRYDRASFIALWDGLPVRVALVSFFNTRLHVPVRLLRKLGALRGRSWGEAGTDLRRPNARVNALLARMFAGEAVRLAAALAGRARPYTHGVSLLAVLEREAR